MSGKCKFFVVMGSIYLCLYDTDLGKESTGEGVGISTWTEAFQFFPKVLATSTPTCEFSAKDNVPEDKHWHKFNTGGWLEVGNCVNISAQIDKEGSKCPWNGFKGNYAQMSC